MTLQTIILGIETAVGGGSLSLSNAQSELGGWCGDDAPLRADDVLIRIDDLLRAARVQKTDISGVAVCAGPGSFTGIRVGIATALGLTRALSIGLSSHSVLEAMASARDLTGMAAIPMGTGSACAQRFAEGTPLDAPFNISIDDLVMLDDPGEFLAHPGLPARAIEKGGTSYFGYNLASALAKLAMKRPLAFTSPIFLSR